MHRFDNNDSQSDLHLCCSVATKSDFFSKGIALRLDARISHKQDVLFPSHIFFLKKKTPQTFPVVIFSQPVNSIGIVVILC